ncbi:hypothetical protein B0T20DRAFT_480375 [Sordaria brevicollis]|uniref:Tetraspanin Tsp3 n=1 Tax=Sordaria brevicollis TaxID=83679 RepID=A0AAE0PB93_SORBR|nr:hypothetical protein B0T20DRAFT_480375 [Sordaria brevicollis]
MMITLSLIYTLITLALLAFAIYQHIHAQSLSLPISPFLTLLTIFLPLLSAFNTAYLYHLSSRPSSSSANRPKLLTTHSSTITPNPANPSQQLTHHLRPHTHLPHSPPPTPNLRSLLPSVSQTLQTTQLVLSIILLTLATSSLTSSPFSLPSDSLERCALEQTWSSYFRSHDADTIRKIQDALKCCGFRSPRHMSWPFPSGNPDEGGKGTGQCQSMWPDRKEGCAKGWEQEFRGVMGGEIAVLGTVVVMQVVGWGLGRWVGAKAARRGGRGVGDGNGNNGWWNKLLQSFGVPHGDEGNGYRGLEDGGGQRRPLLGESQGHVGIEEVEDDEDEDGEEDRDVERGHGGNGGYGSAGSRVQTGGIQVADPWRDER